MKASKLPSIFRNIHLGQTMSSEMTFSPSSYRTQSEETRHLSRMAVSNVFGRLFPRMGCVGCVEISQKRYWLNTHSQILHKQVITKTDPRNPAEREALGIILGKLSMYFPYFLGYVTCSCLIQWNSPSSNIAVKEMWGNCFGLISILIKPLTQSQLSRSWKGAEEFEAIEPLR